MALIVLVDDEKNILSALRRALRARDWSLELFTDPNEALQFIADNDVDVIISDYRMPQMTGTELLSEAMNLKPDTMRIILSGQADWEGIVSAINDAQIFRFVAKPWSTEELKLTIRQALYFREIKQENIRLREMVRSLREAEQQNDVNNTELLPDVRGITKVERDKDGAILLTE